MTIKESSSALVEARKALQENRNLRLQIQDLETSRNFLLQEVADRDAQINGLKDTVSELRDDVYVLDSYIAELHKSGHSLYTVSRPVRFPKAFGGPDA